MSAEAPRPEASVQPPSGPARMGSSEDDAALVASTVAGDRAAFGVLVERYAGQARRAEPLDASLVGGGPRPDAIAVRSELGERLRAALKELPERRRTAVVLFDVEGYSHAEIAGILGIPEGTVRSEVFHARRRLRTLLADWKEQAR